jgi:hypothetical protein
VRCEVYFQETFADSKLFDEVFVFLSGYGFILANLDYDGRGSCQSYFCPNPKFGVLTGCEAVFIRDNNFYIELTDIRFLKAIIFLFLNNLKDLALRYMLTRKTIFQTISRDTEVLVRNIEKLFLLSAKELQYQPGFNFQNARKDYERLFGKKFPDMHRFYESNFLNPE